MKEKNNDREVAIESFETLSQILIAGATATVTDPVIGAGLGSLLGQFFALRGKLKMNRATSFIIELGKYMESIDGDFDWKNADREDFQDIMENIMTRAVKTNSIKKLERYKLLAANQIIEPKPYDYISRYIDLTEKLSDKQMSILIGYVESEEEFVAVQDELGSLYNQKERYSQTIEKLLTNVKVSQLAKYKKDIQKLDGEIVTVQNRFNQLRRLRNREFNEMEDGEFNFMLFDLRTLGLIYNPAQGRASDTGEFSGFRCTPLAFAYLKFLKLSE